MDVIQIHHVDLTVGHSLASGRWFFLFSLSFFPPLSSIFPRLFSFFPEKNYGGNDISRVDGIVISN